MGVQVQVNGVFLELFKDEGISLVKKALDYEKVSSSWSDYSQAFTIPASKINNKVFDYYFNPGIIDGFDPFATNSCKIFIESQLQAQGTVRIVNIKFKDDLPISYSIQFFSDSINLKEALKNKTIADIDWSSYNHVITVNDVKNYLGGTAITGAYTEDLYYPFISVRNLLKWDNPNALTYKEGVSFIAGTTTGVLFDEFRPAAPISLIVRELFNLAGFEVTNHLIGDDVYDKAHLWLNNTETLTGVSAGVQESMAQLNKLTYVSKNSPLAVKLIDFSNEIANDGGFMEDGGFRIPKTETYIFTLNSVPSVQSEGKDYRYRMRINGINQVWNTMTGTRNEVDTITIALTVDDFIDFEFEPFEIFSLELQQWTSMKVQSQSAFVSNFVVSKYVPKMDAVKFIQGVLDMHNALLYFDSSTGKFTIQNRKDWLEAGQTRDISTSIDTSTKTMRPPTFFNSFEFAMGEGEDISSELFRDVFGKNHGTTTYTAGNVYGENFKRELPFTVPLMRFIQSDQADASAGPHSTENLITTTCVDKSYEPVNPNAFILVKESPVRITSASWKVIDYTGTSASSTLSNDFRTDTNLGNTISFSTILGADESTVFTDTLFLNYYSDYINSLYGQSIRRYKFNANIPLNIVSYIRPNDIIIINLVKYMIEDITTNTLTGKSVLNLITRP